MQTNQTVAQIVMQTEEAYIRVYAGNTLTVINDIDFSSEEVLLRVDGAIIIGGSFLNYDKASISFNNAITYNGNTPQTILATSYEDLTFSGIGQKNILGSVSVDGTLSSGTNTTINIWGTNTSLSANSFVSGTSTYNFKEEGAQTIPSLAFYNLILSGSGNKTLGTPLTVSNDLTTSGTAQFTAGDNDITVSGSFINNATTTAGSSNFTLNGTFENNGTFTLGDEGLLTLGGSSFSGSSAISVSNLNVGVNGTYTLNNGITIEPKGSVTLTNNTTTLNANGNLTLDADLTGFSRVATIPTGSSIDNSVTAKAYLNATSRNWWHLSNAIANPAASQWVDDFIITGDFIGNSNDLIIGNDYQSMYVYDETNESTNMDHGWGNFPNLNANETMGIGVGYRAFIRDDRTNVSAKTIDVSGTLNQGNITIPLDYTPTGTSESDGWNFIGNPYPSSLDWNTVTKTGMTDLNAYVWDAQSKNYSYSSDIVIASFQGFWVQTTNGTDLSLTETNKTSEVSTLQRPLEEENLILVSLLDKNPDQPYNYAETSIYINTEATLGFDGGVDASFLSRNMFTEIDFVPIVDIATRIEDGKRLKENHLPESSDVLDIPLYLEYAGTNEYTIIISTKNYVYGEDILLIDSYTNEQKLFTNEEILHNITLTDESSRASDRFSIQIGARPVGLNDNSENSSIVVYPNPSNGNEVSVKIYEAYSNVSISILDITGTVVYTEEVNNSNSSLSTTISTENLEAGIYFVNVTSNGSTHSEKLVINK